MCIQKTDWGQILWLHTCDEQQPSQSINVGLVLVERGKKQAMHIHYGEEQFIYIFEGTGRHTVDGKTDVHGPGSGIYMPPGVAHEMENIGNGQIRGLLCSNSVSFLPKFSMNLANVLQHEEADAVCADLNSAVEALRPTLRDTFPAPYAIFDAEWNLLLHNDQYPDFCVRTCDPCANPGETKCLASPAANADTGETITRFLCPYGLVVYQLPLVYRGTLLGWIRGGHIMQSVFTEGKIVTTYDTPQGTAIGIQNLLRQLGRALLAYCEFDHTRREIDRKNELFEHAEIQKKELERHLRLSEDKATGLLINRHFLFNTLNCMADMALKKEGESLYDAIIRLAGILHYTAQKTKPFVSLRQELAHVDNYLSLQALRLNGALTVTKSIPDDLLRCCVPMDFMQPIVENAFAHGFKHYLGEKKIGIRIEPGRNARISILISNNGVLPGPADVEKVNHHITSGNGHGLNLIFAKLTILYGGDFSMRMLIAPDRDTGVLVEIPMRFEEFARD